ncbi:MAG: hypothetical protein ACR2IM_01625, partial [Sediminibacterium sp.]
ITLIIPGCYNEYRYPKKRVVVYNRYNNYRSNLNRPLFYAPKSNWRKVNYSNNYRFKPRIK